jgi:hypothetical protein
MLGIKQEALTFDLGTTGTRRKFLCWNRKKLLKILY